MMGTMGTKKSSKGDDELEKIFCNLDGTGMVTPDTIFGSGNSNRGFTIVRNNCIEVALRAKVRFPTPSDVLGSGGIPCTPNTATYTFEATPATPPTAGTSPYQCFNVPYCESTPLWSFDYTINLDWQDVADEAVCPTTFDNFEYKICMDADPDQDKEKFTCIDPVMPSLVNPVASIATFGNNDMAGDDGVTFPELFATEVFLPLCVGIGGSPPLEPGSPCCSVNLALLALDPPDAKTVYDYGRLCVKPYYPVFLAANEEEYNLIQNSANYEFYNSGPDSSLYKYYDPSIPGTYKICLEVKSSYDDDDEIKVCIDVVQEE